jgi:hypothetical protein
MNDSRCMLKNYVKKSMRVGLRNVIKIVYIRLRVWYKSRLPYIHEHNFSKKTGYAHSFDIFFIDQQKRHIRSVTQLYDSHLDKQALREMADRYAHKSFSCLGSSLEQYQHIPWHSDFRLQQQDRTADILFDKQSLYTAISIEQGNADLLVKDIKVPWELARFQYLYILGKAYEHTHEQRYVDAFQFYICDWLDTNTAYHGIHWLCPMEVSIRAINWILAWEFFKEAPLSLDFWQRFTMSLYDHMIYIENNWEYYDSRTNNHYVSNLVGYLYLCWFFSDLPQVRKKHTWVTQEILREFKKQVFNEGTSYEGSTTYHRLVTELFYHASLLFKEMNSDIPDYFYTTLSRMFDFISWSTIRTDTFVTIGDNDSGTLLYYGLTDTIIARMQTKASNNTQLGAYFARFGLSIVKNEAWHITLRHHAYHALQPSGHFHNDIASITLAVDGIPVIVDPGSYIYTPSVIWRNHFRSVAVHNTSFIEEIEPTPLSHELFTLPLTDQIACESPVIYADHTMLSTRHSLYAFLGLEFIRQVRIYTGYVNIDDQWIQQAQDTHTYAWHFLLAPSIHACYHDDGILLAHNDRPLLIIQSNDLLFMIQESWYSPAYGQKVATHSLYACRLGNGNAVRIRLVRST